MSEKKNAEGLEGIVRDPETGAWLVLSKSTDLVIEMDSFHAAVTYAKETEGWT